MKHKLEYAREKKEKIIGSFQSSYMSDSKWVKLLRVLSNSAGLVSSSKVKLVWDEEVREIEINENISYNFDYYEKSMESMISGYPKGFYDYKEIEWVEFLLLPQNISKFDEVLDSVGKFEMEAIENGFRLYGYK